MPPFSTAAETQATTAADDSDDDDRTDVQVTCLACAQAHLVNPKTGKVLGSEGE
jgi:hypothetical protein